MEIPEAWTGPQGHCLQQPGVPADVRASFAELIDDLEGGKVAGLGARRAEFREAGQLLPGDSPQAVFGRVGAFHRILEMRFELLVAAQLQRAGVLVRMRTDTPDFDCRAGGLDFGVEVTTRARAEAASMLHAYLEAALAEGPNLHIMLQRTGERLFTKSPAEVREVASRLVETAKRMAPADRPLSIPIPELALTAFVVPRVGLNLPGMRVTYESPPTWDDSWLQHHLKYASMQVRDTIVKKGARIYDEPSIVVIDVSRLGEVSRSDDGVWNLALSAELESCDLGNACGVLIVRTVLNSRDIVELAWRGSDALRPAVSAVLKGDQFAG